MITFIKVCYYADNGLLWGLIFYSGDNETARIGVTTHPHAASTIIDIKEGEIWCGVCASNDEDGLKENL